MEKKKMCCKEVLRKYEKCHNQSNLSEFIMLALVNSISCHASVMAVQLQNVPYHHRPLTKVNNHMNLYRFPFSWVLKKFVIVPIIASLNNKRLPASLNNQMKQNATAKTHNCATSFITVVSLECQARWADGLGHLQTMK